MSHQFFIFRRSSFLCSLLVALAAAPVWGAQGYLPAGAVSAVDLLPPPPQDGSAEQKADLATVQAAFKNRTKADEELGQKQQKGITFYSFAPVIGNDLDPEKLPATTAMFEKVAKDTKSVIDGGKNHWKRQRPYEVDASLSLGEKEPSFGYPSGHSTRGTVYSLLLAELYPDKAAEILQYGRDMGWRRVMLGKHYPTDIYAGQVLGKAIVRALQANPEFEHDLAAAKAEIQQSQLQTAKR